MGISFWHIIIVLVVVLLLFGAGKIPRLMKDLGSGITAFKKGLKENETPDPPPAGTVTPASPQIPSSVVSAADKREDVIKR